MENYFLAIDENRGIYAPKAFAKLYGGDSNIKPQDMEILLAGPENDSEAYWEIWWTVIDYCRVTLEGKIYTIEERGDIWLIEEGTEINWYWNE